MYNAAMSCCRWDLALELMRRLKARLRPTVVSYNALLAAGGPWLRAVEIFEEMKRMELQAGL